MTKRHEMTTTLNSFLDSFERTLTEGAADGIRTSCSTELSLLSRIRRSSRERRRLRDHGMYVGRFRVPEGRMLKMKMVKNEKGELVVIVRFSKLYT